MQLPVCTLALPAAQAAGAWGGPRIRLALPSFRWDYLKWGV